MSIIGNQVLLFVQEQTNLENIKNGPSLGLATNVGNVSNERTSIKFESTYQERLAQTPVNNGKWTVQRGESTFIHENKEILSKVDKKGIDYFDAIPDFSSVSKGKVEIEGMSIDRNANFKKADELLAEKWKVAPKEVRKWRKRNQYEWHELNDKVSMELVPTLINGKFGHLGGVSEVGKALKNKNKVKLMIQIEHKNFGKLSYDYGWKRDIQINLFGYERIVTLIIDGDDDAEFEEAHINSYNSFFRDKDSLLRQAEDAILKYYLEVYMEYRERLGDQFADTMAPILSTKEEISKIVEPKQLLFPMVFDEDIRQVGLLLECTWEPEHGLAVKFEDEKVIEVGYQDIVL